ncbi:MAG TPA: MFS transporter [Candidatus Dormibacteraeota bacterium]|nr:MFS transporter [Candidatus Dormibacteraeota bacterium]
MTGEGPARTRALLGDAIAEMAPDMPVDVDNQRPARPPAARTAHRAAGARSPATAPRTRSRTRTSRAAAVAVITTRPRLAFATLCGVTVLALLDATLMAASIPSVHGSLGASGPEARAAVTAALVGMGMAVPVAAGAGDRLGPARLLRGALGALVLGGALSALSWSLAPLLVLRSIQGIAAGLLLPAAITMLLRLRPQRAWPLAAAGGAALLLLALAPALLAWLGGHLPWRITAAAVLPLGGPFLLLAWFSLPAVRGAAGARSDLAGMATASLTLGSLLLALLEAPVWGWTSMGVLALLCCSLLSVALLAVVELSVPAPLIDLRPLRSAAVRVPALLLAICAVALASGFLELPLLLQGPGAGAGAAAVTLLIPASLAAAALAGALPLCARVGARWPAAAGLLAAALGTALLHGVAPAETLRLVVLASVRGAGLGLALGALATTAAPAAAAGVRGSAGVLALGVLLPAAGGGALIGSALGVAPWSPGSQAASATLAQRLVLLHGDATVPLAAGSLTTTVLLTAAICAVGGMLSLLLPSRGAAPRP